MSQRNNSHDTSRRAQGTLAFVFLAGSIIILVGLTLAFLLLSFINTSAAFQAANRASAAAAAGIEDAVLQVVRGKNFNPSPGTSYQISLGEITVQITAVRDLPAAGQVLITSFVNVSGSQRKIQAVISVAPDTREVSVLSWQQVVI